MSTAASDRLNRLRETARRYAESPRGRTVLRITRWVFLLGVIGWLVAEMTAIGWGEIWKSLPRQPLFYVLFIALYLLLPVAEVIIYRVTWQFPGWAALPAFIKKRVYNKDVLGYSGEIYFFSWARKNVQLRDGQILETIRDNNIISSVASTLIAIILLSVFLLVGEISLTRIIGADWPVYLALGAVSILVLTPIALRFRKYLFSMPFRVAALIFGIQCARLALGQVLQIGQWEVVMPEVSMRVWFTFAAVSIMLTRIPLLPNQNLIFLGAGVELSHMMDISSAGVAGMLLVTNVLDKALNLGLFGLITVFEPNIAVSDQAAEPGPQGTNSEPVKAPDP